MGACTQHAVASLESPPPRRERERAQKTAGSLAPSAPPCRGAPHEPCQPRQLHGHCHRKAARPARAPLLPAAARAGRLQVLAARGRGAPALRWLLRPEPALSALPRQSWRERGAAAGLLRAAAGCKQRPRAARAAAAQRRGPQRQPAAPASPARSRAGGASCLSLSGSLGRWACQGAQPGRARRAAARSLAPPARRAEPSLLQRAQLRSAGSPGLAGCAPSEAPGRGAPSAGLLTSARRCWPSERRPPSERAAER